MYACDLTWWRVYFPEVSRTFRGEKWTVGAAARDAFDLHWVYGLDRPGLSRDPTFIHTGRNSGFQAIGLAALFGAARIILLGFDMQRTGGKSHWHGDHPRSLGQGDHYSRWAAAMNQLAKDAAAAGIEIINCSRKTALQCFPQRDLEETLCQLPTTPSPS